MRPQKRTNDWPQRDSGKPSGTFGEESNSFRHCFQCRWGSVDFDWGYCGVVERLL